MIKQLGFISVAALSLAALSACEGQQKPGAPIETKTGAPVAPQAMETIHVDPAAGQRLKTMYGNDLAEVLGGPDMKANAQNTQTIAPAMQPALDEASLKANLHKSGQVVPGAALETKSQALGGVK